mgnify:CR=1 FL=1
MSNLFSESEHSRLSAAIEEAETQSGAEIVPYVAVQSDAYPAVRWRGGVLAALLAAGLLVLLRANALLPLPVPAGLVELSAMLAAGGLGAFTAGTIPSLMRFLVPAREAGRAVKRRALQAFVEEEVFATRDRTGILLFVSLLEHRIEVLADTGIDRQVDDNAWTDVTHHIRTGIEEDRLTQGLLNGIACCGRLLDEHGLDPDGPNELDDRVRSEMEPGSSTR